MSDKTKIEWTDATWNPIRGCSRVSEGCRNCYAESVANRFKGEGQPYEGLIAKGGQWNGQIKLVPEALEQPLRWKRPRRIFVNSMSDLFHENVPFHFIDEVFYKMRAAHWHTFQVLTKRPQRMIEWADSSYNRHTDILGGWDGKNPLPNVWLGVSVEDQKTADERIPLLLQTPAAVRWISAEPLLGAINLEQCAPHIIGGDESNPGVMNAFNGMCYHPRTCLFEPGKAGTSDGIQWVVVGGESGKNARPMHPDWARSLRDQCKTAGVPFLFKQWGEFAPNWLNDDFGNKLPNSEWINRMGKKAAGRELDGYIHDEFPVGSK